jgi:hypothetical protein
MDIVSVMLTLLLQLLVVLGLLLWADRWLHRHLQGVMLLLTEDPDIARWLYAIVLLPGVALHELSHALMATLVGVKIGRIHLLPKATSDKRLQLGFVPVQATDIFRASLIGAAPLIIGSITVVAIGALLFQTPEILTALSSGDLLAAGQGLLRVLQAPDVWLWVYLVAAISNTMLPSRSDVHAWPALALVIGIVVALLVAIGGTTVLLDGAGRFLTVALRWFVLLSASTFLVDLPIFAVLFLLEKGLVHFKQIRIDYELGHTP